MRTSIHFLIHGPTVPTWFTRSNRRVAFSTRDKPTEDHPPSNSFQLLFDYIPLKRKLHSFLFKLLSTDVFFAWCGGMVLEYMSASGKGGIFIVKNECCDGSQGLHWPKLYKLFKGWALVAIQFRSNFRRTFRTPTPWSNESLLGVPQQKILFLLSQITRISISIWGSGLRAVGAKIK